MAAAQLLCLSGTALTQAAESQNWDPSVQALVVFPDVMKRLNEDITWTTSLGNAFLAQQADVMNSIQHMRGQAEQNGKLASTPQQQVNYHHRQRSAGRGKIQPHQSKRHLRSDV